MDSERNLGVLGKKNSHENQKELKVEKLEMNGKS